MFGPSSRLAASLLWPLLTPDQSRQRLLARALCPSFRSLPVRSFAAGSLPRRPDQSVEQRSPLLVRNVSASLADQVSPGKNAMFPCTSAAFTLSAASDGLRHEVPTRPQTRPSMQFLSVASHVCAPASSRQVLTALPLPSASGYHRSIMNPCRHSHRGLSPHYIAPMLGAHPTVNRTACKLRLQVRSCLRPPPAGYLAR